MAVKETIGTHIRELREKKRLTQPELAEKIDIKRPSITAYESGNQLPPVDTLIKVADCFNVSLDFLTGRTKDRRLHRFTEPDINQFQGLTDQEYEILSIISSAVDQILEGREPKQTIESLAKMADHEQLSEEYKILMVVLSKMVVERYKKMKDQELKAMEMKVKELEHK
jgi:transcriptional regulator with XRE-family HTH domain